MLKPLSQMLHEQNGGASTVAQLDAVTVAASFGAQILPVNEPLPETAVRIPHAEEDRANPTLNRRPPQPKEPAEPLLKLMETRLRSLKSISPTRSKEIEKLIYKLYAPLKAVDDFIETVEEERLISLGDQWEMRRKQGRKIKESLDKLIGAVNQSMMVHNESEAQKKRCEIQLQADHLAGRRLSKWATEQEISDAEELVAEDRIAKQAADEQWLTTLRALTEAQNAVAIARAQVEGIEQEMSRLEAEIQGASYCDPTTGLSVDPLGYRAGW
jgi:hypothetical protein